TTPPACPPRRSSDLRPTQPLAPSARRRPGLTPRGLLVVVIGIDDLAANLAGREGRRVHVHVRRAEPDATNQLLELARRDPLLLRSEEHTSELQSREK